MNILQKIVLYKREEEVPRRMSERPLEDVRQAAAQMPPPLNFSAALHQPGQVSLIAEIKRASPSKGILNANLNPLNIAAIYQANGAAALSILTDEPFFQGRLEVLAQIRRAFPNLPLLRKDFIVHEYQVYEARSAGADALLLIAAVLSDKELAHLLTLTHELDMEALIEVHDQNELQRALALSPRVVGVNNRNLADFSVNLNTCLELRECTPSQVCFVAESGIHTRQDVQKLTQSHVDAMLVGEALVTAPDVAGKMKELLDNDSEY